MSKDFNLIDIGELEELDEIEIRKIWPHEERNLSPWIKENIKKINDILNLQIEIESSEEYVLNFRLDLAGTEAYTELPVVIENQFGKSNHDHLGKLITYSAHKEAGILIWIANEFTEAHKNAIEWLNDITPNDMIFYALALKVYKIEKSKPAPFFMINAGPPPKKKKKYRPDELTDRSKKYLDYFTTIKQKIDSLDRNIIVRNPIPKNYIHIDANRTGFHFGLSFAHKKRFRIELYIDTGENDKNKIALSQLEENKDKISGFNDGSLEWEYLPGSRAKRVALYKDNITIDSNEQELEELDRFILNNLPIFHERFSKLLPKIELDFI